MLPSIERTEPARTVIVPRVERPAARGRLRFLLPWLAFGAVAVVVVGGTSLWSVTLRSAGRAGPEPAGIGTALAAVAPPSLAALPTTPAAPVTTAAVFRSPSPRPRVVAPPPPPAAVPLSVAVPPTAVPPTDPAPSTPPAPVGCAEPPSCPSAPPSGTEKRVTDSTTLPETET